MRKRIDVNIQVSLTKTHDSVRCVLNVHREALRDLCLGLCILNEQLAESVSFVTMDGQSEISIQVHSTPKQQPIIGKIEESNVLLTIGQSEFGYVLVFLLKYYRDGVAEVDHIDLDGTLGGSHDTRFEFTMKVPDAVPPITLDEAIRLLEGM